MLVKVVYVTRQDEIVTKPPVQGHIPPRHVIATELFDHDTDDYSRSSSGYSIANNSNPDEYINWTTARKKQLNKEIRDEYHANGTNSKLFQRLISQWQDCYRGANPSSQQYFVSREEAIIKLSTMFDDEFKSSTTFQRRQEEERKNREVLVQIDVLMDGNATENDWQSFLRDYPDAQKIWHQSKKPGCSNWPPKLPVPGANPWKDYAGAPGWGKRTSPRTGGGKK